MSKLKEFVGAPKEVDIKGKKLTLYPLKVDDLKMFKENLSEEEQMKLSVETVRKSLNDPEVTEEEIKNMSMDYFIILMDEISKLNGLEDERIRKIKERVVQARVK